MDVAARLVELRKDRDMSQYALWKASGVAQGMLSEYESGKKVPGIDVLERICAGLGVSLAEFFDVKTETPPEERAVRKLAVEVKRLGAINDDGTVDEEALSRIIRFLRSGSELVGKSPESGE